MRDKQIEEMAFDMSESLVYFKGEPQIINWVKTLENMHTKGYRKASDVAREIFEEIEKYSEVALMNGHIETPILCIGFGVLAELKKKYLGEDINAPTKESEGEG